MTAKEIEVLIAESDRKIAKIKENIRLINARLNELQSQIAALKSIGGCTDEDVWPDALNNGGFHNRATKNWYKHNQ